MIANYRHTDSFKMLKNLNRLYASLVHFQMYNADQCLYEDALVILSFLSSKRRVTDIDGLYSRSHISFCPCEAKFSTYNLSLKAASGFTIIEKVEQ